MAVRGTTKVVITGSAVWETAGDVGADPTTDPAGSARASTRPISHQSRSYRSSRSNRVYHSSRSRAASARSTGKRGGRPNHGGSGSVGLPPLPPEPLPRPQLPLQMAVLARSSTGGGGGTPVPCLRHSSTRSSALPCLPLPFRLPSSSMNSRLIRTAETVMGTSAGAERGHNGGSGRITIRLASHGADGGSSGGGQSSGRAAMSGGA